MINFLDFQVRLYLPLKSITQLYTYLFLKAQKDQWVRVGKMFNPIKRKAIYSLNRCLKIYKSNVSPRVDRDVLCKKWQSYIISEPNKLYIKLIVTLNINQCFQSSITKLPLYATQRIYVGARTYTDEYMYSHIRNSQLS